jgi:hypothetical protein
MNDKSTNLFVQAYKLFSKGNSHLQVAIEVKHSTDCLHSCLATIYAVIPTYNDCSKNLIVEIFVTFVFMQHYLFSPAKP